MYRKKGRSWTKHIDFMLLDVLCMQIAFIVSYICRFGLNNPYIDKDYRILAVAFLLIDFFVEIVSDAVNADVFLLPSRWEGLPISLLESMYMKKACVVSNVIGNRDVIHNGENGFVCTKVEDFVKAIEECQGEVEKLTEHEYQDILKMYNTKVMAEQYSKKYETAMNR